MYNLCHQVQYNNKIKPCHKDSLQQHRSKNNHKDITQTHEPMLRIDIFCQSRVRFVSRTIRTCVDIL